MNHDPKASPIPDETSSIWFDTVHLPSFQLLKENLVTEVTIVGAGITGITSAYLLAKAGLKVALIDAGQLCSGTTGHTTAKITAQHSLIYDELIGHVGEEKARLYYKANQEAVDWIANMVRKHDIHCDFQEQPAIVYAEMEKEAGKIEKELEAYNKLGIPCRVANSLDLPLQVKKALIMPHQAQFHPLMYLHFLISRLAKMDVPIYEQTMAVDIEESGSCIVRTEEGYRITSRDVLICSHFPFYDKGFYFARMYPERSYLMAVETENPIPEGMYISAGEPKRSIRSLSAGKPVVLVGGENHKTGRGENTSLHFQKLAHFAGDVLGKMKIINHWSAQDYTTLDKIPYIGRLSSAKKHIYVATGFRKWGMTSGTLAARLLSDQILERDNPYSSVFSPSRFAADPMVRRFVIENSKVAAHLIKGKIERARTSVDDLENDQGIIISLNGKRAGAYKDEKGKIVVVDTTCTHMGCEVNWNQGERTWDCPCHGSRYKPTGEVIDGPARKPLNLLFAESKDTESKDTEREG
ncbi:FAD-dependent oxidoreductase [Sporolactobacillus sp. THM7-4]|nr:FAD-dependent oxidoreductase [Sporolactobacillus sp. THM7-4]